MKKLISFLFVTLLLIMGCNNESELTSPVENNIIQEPNWITFSDNGRLSIEDTFIKSRYSADGRKGWNITFDYTFPNGIRTYGDLNCPKNAYEGKINVTLMLSNLVTTTDFTPSPFTFNIPVEYTIIYEGLDLTGVNPANVDFYYIAPDGSIVKAVYEDLQVDIPNGRLFVLDARLPHFSRYGFVN